MISLFFLFHPSPICHHRLSTSRHANSFPDANWGLLLSSAAACSVELMLGDKRSNGMLDFGLARGMSGVDAAKARLGLKYANDPYGPGRR